jgi:hypothetical protein
MDGPMCLYWGEIWAKKSKYIPRIQAADLKILTGTETQVRYERGGVILQLIKINIARIYSAVNFFANMILIWFCRSQIFLLLF